MTPEELKSKLDERKALNQQLEQLINDEEQLIALQNSLKDKTVKQINVSLNLPTGEAIAVVITDRYGEKYKYSSTSPSNHIVATMLEAGIAEAASDINTRKQEIVNKL